jgi:hypothetical protein
MARAFSPAPSSTHLEVNPAIDTFIGAIPDDDVEQSQDRRQAEIFFEGCVCVVKNE